MDGEVKFRSAEFLGHLVRGMADGVIFIDQGNIVQVCNPVGSTLMGVRGDELLGKDFMECHPKEVMESVLKVVNDLRTGRIKDDSRVVSLKGRFYEHAYSAVRDHEGNYLGVVSVSKDVTDREVLERELKEYTMKLEHSNHLKDLFADIMRHDFINPASIIRSYADMALEEGLTGELRDDLATIKRSSDRLIELIDNASKFSKLEDADSLKFQEKDLTAMIKDMIKEQEQSLLEKNMKVTFNSQKRYQTMVSLFMDDVFYNILSNAIKYGPKGSEIIVDIKDKGTGLLISVSDEADQIPPEHRTSIFERFKRVGKRSVKGSGLGLAIVKRVMDLHKGKVWVGENKRGGNTFYLEIPKNLEG